MVIPRSCVSGDSSSVPRHSVLPHRLAWLLAFFTFQLIWIGGSVTMYGAGMAVPDWPNTYGYNLFLYPLRSWLRVWDVFLEDSHRLVGASVGLITIAMAASLWLLDRRGWMRTLGLVTLAGVIFQGVLGGLRVVGNDLFLAKVHGCTAPLFFTLCGSLVVFTSSAWCAAEAGPANLGSADLGPDRRASCRCCGWFGLIASVAIYLQIVAGANLRHFPPDADTGRFILWVWLHVLGAVTIFIAGMVLLGLTFFRPRSGPRLRCRARILALLILVQVSLGLATWVTKYGFPRWFQEYLWAAPYTVAAKDWPQAFSVTAHTGAGSLCLAAAISLTLWAFHESKRKGRSPGFSRSEKEEPPEGGTATIGRFARLRDYWLLIRPRIIGLVLFTMTVAALAADPEMPPWTTLAHSVAGAGMVIAGAIALNQRIERRTDALMLRTARRLCPPAA